MESFKVETKVELVKEDEDPEVTMWRERGVDVSVKPPCEKEWSPFDVAMNKHFKYEVQGLDFCYKLIDMTAKDDLDDLEFQWILPLDFLLNAKPEAWKKGILSQLLLRV